MPSECGQGKLLFKMFTAKTPNVLLCNWHHSHSKWQACFAAEVVIWILSESKQHHKLLHNLKQTLVCSQWKFYMLCWAVWSVGIWSWFTETKKNACYLPSFL